MQTRRPLAFLAAAVLVLFAASARAAQPAGSFLEQIPKQMSMGYPADEPGVALIIVKDGEVLFHDAFGKASLELGVDLEPEHTFCVASVTKTLTATAVMSLVEDGALALDAKANDLLPDVNIDARITVEHLLRHTSGLPDFFEIEGFRDSDPLTALTPAELVQAADGLTPEFEPGTQQQYCNLNYALLGRLVELATGKPLDDVFRERIYEPAGMTRTVLAGDGTIVPGAVRNYTGAPGEWRTPDPINYSRGFGLGSIFTNTDDLAAFAGALTAGKLLKPETVAQMHTPTTLPSGETGRYGLCWVISEQGGMTFVSHGGSIIGWRARIVLVPEHNVFVAMLANRGEERSMIPGLAMMIAARVAAME